MILKAHAEFLPNFKIELVSINITMYLCRIVMCKRVQQEKHELFKYVLF